MAITTMDGMIAAMPGQYQPSFKVFTPQAAGAYTALSHMPGLPGTATNPSSGMAGAVVTDASGGYFPFTNPGGGAFTYMGQLSAASVVSGVLLIYDRLWEQSGINVTLNTAQTINSVALTRPDALGADVELWGQVYTTMGAGTPTITASYTDQDNNSGNTATSGALVTTMAAGRTFPFQLAAGDTGVRSIQTVTQSATMTSGTWGLVLRRRLATVPLAGSNAGVIIDAFGSGMPRIYDDAALEFVWLASATTANIVMAEMNFIQG